MRHWIVLWLIISVAVSAIALFVEKVLHLPLVQTAQYLITEPGPTAGLAIALLLSLDLLLPVPSSFVMMLSGAMFGVWGGGLVSLVGSLAGNFAGFELARRYGVGIASRLVGKAELDKMGHFFSSYGPLAIILSRPLPVIMETLSLVAGLSAMNRGTFLGSSLLGTIPVCMVYAYAGSYSIQIGNLVPVLLVGIGIPAVAWLVIQIALRRLR